MTALAQLAELAKILGVEDRQRRVKDGAIIAIAGWYGIVRPAENGTEALRLVCAHPDRLDDDARKQLAWAGVIARLTNRSFELRRMPSGVAERSAFRALLGLERGRAAA